MHKGKGNSSNFKKGICTLVLIMLVFGLSYFLRILMDFFIIDYNDLPCFRAMILDQVMGIPYDLLPIMLIVCLHRKNLMAGGTNNNKKDKRMYADEDDALIRQMSDGSTSSQLTY